jgi:hypothetical protein
MMLQTLPPTDFWTWLTANKAWNDFPVVFLIVACFVIAGIAARWFWGDYKKFNREDQATKAIEAEKDRKWKEEQNEKREIAQDSRDKQFRDILTGQYAAIEKISSNMITLTSDLHKHDELARHIARVAERTEEQTRPMNQRRPPDTGPLGSKEE